MRRLLPKRRPRVRRAEPGEGDTRVLPSPSLHACMVGLVLLNLVFVQLTEAASPAWLVPLYVLTLLSTALARFKERFLYRALWNLGVVGFFTKLLSHALSADLAYVLQDGLTLAVLCQVHLLNNLHRNQRPDLLFLNSYLIAVITGYITVDLGFAGAFLAYVPFYILGLQFLAVFRPGGRLTGREARLLAWDGAKRSALLLFLALLAFAFWPRDFEREALLARYFDFSPADGTAKVDFSESLDLGKRRDGDGGPGAVVLTIAQARDGSNASASTGVTGIPALWRGATLARHKRDGSWAKLDGEEPGLPAPFAMESEALSGKNWVTGDPPWTADAEALSVRRGAAAEAPSRRFRVTRAGGSTRVIFHPLNAVEVELEAIHKAGKIRRTVGGTLRYSNPGELRYEVTVQEPEPSRAAPSKGDFLNLEPSSNTKVAVDLAGLLREKRVPEDADDAEVARAFSDYLRDRYPYRLPSGDEEDMADSLHEFLTTEKGGHCEFFASALATMLRAEAIPARVVTGFRVGAMDAETKTWTVRATAAHAWVEAHVDGRWQTFDPTPAADLEEEGDSWLERANAAALAFWSRVTTFDGDSRAKLTAWAGNLPARAVAWIAGAPWLAAMVLALVGALATLLVRRRRAQTPVSVRALRKAMRQAKVRRAPEETPRQVLQRVEALGALDPEGVKALRRAVLEHERARFGGKESAPSRGAPIGGR